MGGDTTSKGEGIPPLGSAGLNLAVQSAGGGGLPLCASHTDLSS